MTQEERLEPWLKEISYLRGQFAGLTAAFSLFVLHTQSKKRVQSYIDEITRAEKIAQREWEKEGDKPLETEVFESGFDDGLTTLRNVLSKAMQDMYKEEG